MTAGDVHPYETRFLYRVIMVLSRWCYISHLRYLGRWLYFRAPGPSNADEDE